VVLVLAGRMIAAARLVLHDQRAAVGAPHDGGIVDRDATLGVQVRDDANAVVRAGPR